MLKCSEELRIRTIKILKNFKKIAKLFFLLNAMSQVSFGIFDAFTSYACMQMIFSHDDFS